MKKQRLLFIVGPTACSKSDLGVAICEALSVPTPEIINCDSVQFFAGVDIGAAKPGPDLLARAKHHLVGHVPLGRGYTAGDFTRDALRVLSEGEVRGVGRFVGVGGSGFYVQALEKGMYDVPEVPEEIRERIESRLDAEGQPALYEELKRLDPETAGRIDPNDRYRIMRALEILHAAPGTTLSAIKERFAAKERPFIAKKIGLFRPRDILRERVGERTRKMLSSGLVDEVESLRKQGLHEWWPMKSVGYKEAQEYLEGRIPSLEKLEELIVTSTMQLAKRQMTWFKRDPSTEWFDVEQGLSKPLASAREFFEE